MSDMIRMTHTDSGQIVITPVDEDQVTFEVEIGVTDQSITDILGDVIRAISLGQTIEIHEADEDSEEI